MFSQPIILVNYRKPNKEKVNRVGGPELTHKGLFKMKA